MLVKVASVNIYGGYQDVDRSGERRRLLSSLYFLLKRRLAGPTGIEPVTPGFLCLAFLSLKSPVLCPY